MTATENIQDFAKTIPKTALKEAVNIAIETKARIRLTIVKATLGVLFLFLLSHAAGSDSVLQKLIFCLALLATMAVLIYVVQRIREAILICGKPFIIARYEDHFQKESGTYYGVRNVYTSIPAKRSIWEMVKINPWTPVILEEKYLPIINIGDTACIIDTRFAKGELLCPRQ